MSKRISRNGVTVYVPTIMQKYPARLTRAVQNTIKNRTMDIYVDFQVTIMTWKHKPHFVIDAKPYRALIYTEDDIYMFVTGGTRRHPITAVNAPALRFWQGGFQAKSTVKVIGSGPGRRADQIYRVVPKPKEVMHPGIKAREFEKEIAKKWRKRAPELLQQAINAEAERLFRENG